MHPIESANLALNLVPKLRIELRFNAYKAIVIAIILFRQRRFFSTDSPHLLVLAGSHFTVHSYLVLTVGYAPTSAAFQTAAFTRLA